MGRADVERLASHHAPPTEWGKKPSLRCGHMLEEAGRPQDEVVVVVVVDVDVDVDIVVDADVC